MEHSCVCVAGDKHLLWLLVVTCGTLWNIVHGWLVVLCLSCAVGVLLLFYLLGVLLYLQMPNALSVLFQHVSGHFIGTKYTSVIRTQRLFRVYRKAHLVNNVYYGWF